jgi:hypothetical protein
VDTILLITLKGKEHLIFTDIYVVLRIHYGEDATDCLLGVLCWYPPIIACRRDTECLESIKIIAPRDIHIAVAGSDNLVVGVIPPKLKLLEFKCSSRRSTLLRIDIGVRGRDILKRAIKRNHLFLYGLNKRFDDTLRPPRDAEG